MDSAAPASEPETAPPRPRRRHHWGLIALGLVVLAIVLVVALWNWDWFLPVVDRQASAALGRPVTARHLHVKLGWQTTTASLDDVTIANPAGFQAAKPFVHVDRLTLDASPRAYLRQNRILIPRIELDRPDVLAEARPDGAANWDFPKLTNTKPAPRAKPGPTPEIGSLVINQGHAQVIDPKLRANFVAAIATRAASGAEGEAITVDARGTYANQPVTGRFVGGALLSLRDKAHPYPIDLRLANGPTKLAIVGTVENPLNFAGARLKLSGSGPDMSLLYPLTGIPIPATPPFSLAGNVDYAGRRIRVTDFTGRMGSSDLAGTITEDPGIGGKPDVTLDLVSRRMDLVDFGGFIGATPGKRTEAGTTAAQKQQLAAASTKKTLLPDTKINLPKINAANVHFRFRGEHIVNKYVPFDNVVMALDLVDGRITLHPLDFGVGRGDVASTIDLAPDASGLVHSKADIKFRRIDITRIMQAAHAFNGQGILGGEAVINAQGNSIASMMAQGNGELKLALLTNGNLSALLVDITGLEFGNALLSALGVPNRAKIQCFVTDLPMRQGIVDTRVLLLDTDEGRITGRGTIDFRNQTLDYQMETRSKHFSIGSLPGPINITGPLGSPSIRPGAEIVARAGAATALGVLLTPLGALLPTIQFGVGDDNACSRAVAAERAPLRAPPPPRRRAHK